MTRKKAKSIAYMIEKELGRNSLVDLCEEWEIEVEEFDEFLECALKYIYMCED